MHCWHIFDDKKVQGRGSNRIEYEHSTKQWYGSSPTKRACLDDLRNKLNHVTSCSVGLWALKISARNAKYEELPGPALFWSKQYQIEFNCPNAGSHGTTCLGVRVGRNSGYPSKTSRSLLSLFTPTGTSVLSLTGTTLFAESCK